MCPQPHLPGLKKGICLLNEENGWSGGGHAHAETYYPSAKGGQKGDPFFVVVAWSRGRVAVVVVMVERSGATCLEKMSFCSGNAIFEVFF